MSSHPTITAHVSALLKSSNSFASQTPAQRTFIRVSNVDKSFQARFELPSVNVRPGAYAKKAFIDAVPVSTFKRESSTRQQIVDFMHTRAAETQKESNNTSLCQPPCRVDAVFHEKKNAHLAPGIIRFPLTQTPAVKLYTSNPQQQWQGNRGMQFFN